VSASLSVRPITVDDLVAWIEVTNVAFHSNRAAEAGAAFRRELLADDFSRNLAAFDGARLVATYESFHTELTLPGGHGLPTNAVTAVSVLPTHHRRGALTRMITHDLQQARQRGEAASILIAAEYPIYGRFGFGPATDHAAYVLETAAAEFTPTADGLTPPGSVELVEPRRMREVAPSLFERFRRAYPGQIDRRPVTWDVRLGLRPSPWRSADQRPRYAVYSSAAGEPEGYLMYEAHGEWRHYVPHGKLEIEELVTLSTAAYAGLWRYMTEIDLVAEISAEMRRVDEPLAWMLTNPRRALRQTNRSDFLWLRALDTPRLLEGRRYAAEERLVFEVDDPLGLAGGRFVLEGSRDGASCRETDASPDVRLGMPALGALSLGGASAHVLHAAGRIDAQTPRAIERTERLFRWPIAPWCSTFF
jgi:predicted acetyltransferase